MSEDKIQFTDRFPVRWGDMDAFGHVNNTEYFRYMEQARVNWLFIEKGKIFQPGTSSFVVVTASCAFLKPLYFPATLIIDSWASDIGNSSVLVHHKIRTEESPETIFAQGHAKIVCIDLQTQRSTPLSAEMKACFAAS
jgi:acyl-CoA thioester hydrolase